MNHSPLKSKYLHFYLFGLYLLIVGYGFEINNTDFYKAYYQVGKAVLEGQNLPYEGVAGFVNLPLFSLLFVPFAFFTEYQAGLLFFASELVVYGIAYYIFMKKWGHDKTARWFIFLLFVINKPFFVGLILGQTSVWALCFLIACIICFEKNNKIYAGILLSAMFIVKVPLGILFFYFLIKKEYKLILSSMISFIAFVVLSVLVFGISEHIKYLNEVWLHNTGGIIAGRYNQNIFALAVRFSFQEMHYYIPVQITLWAKMISSLFIATFIIFILSAFFGNASKKIEDQKLIEYSIFLTFIVWASPLSWEHYYVFLILPLFSLFRIIKKLDYKFGYFSVFAMAAWILINFPYKIVYQKIYDAFPDVNSQVYPIVISTPFLGAFSLTILLLVGFNRLKQITKSHV